MRHLRTLHKTKLIKRSSLSLTRCEYHKPGAISREFRERRSKKPFINFYVALKGARWRLAFDPDFQRPKRRGCSKGLAKNVVVLGQRR